MAGAWQIWVGFETTDPVAATWISPFDPTTMHAASRLSGPGWPFLLGTDFYGRDLLSRILWGLRSSLAIALLSVTVSALAGAALGIVSGCQGGRVDTLVMRAMSATFLRPILEAIYGELTVTSPDSPPTVSR